MQFYPQLLLWTYVLLPAISLLLSPTFFIALARAQQQRAKIMTNALTARGRAAAALARANQRRYLPRYSNGFGQFKPFKMRSKRELDMGVPEIGIDEKPIEASMIARKSHWDQQEESLGQLENMWNMNNFGISQNEGVRSMHDKRPEKSTEAIIVGDPFMHSARNRNKNYGESDYYAGAFSGRNVFDGVLEQSEHVFSINQDENEPSNEEGRLANPEPTLKKIKKLLNKKEEPHQQNYYNSYHPQNSYGSSYNYPYGRSDETETPPHNGETEDTLVIGEPSNEEGRLANPEPTLKKIKKLLNKKEEPHQQNYYNSYHPQNSYGSSYNYPYGRSDETETPPHNGETEDAQVIGDPSITDEKVGNPDPTFKKLKKKLNKKQEPHQQNYYNYYPQYSHGSSYGYPYGRSDETEILSQNEVLEMEDTPQDFISDPSITDVRVGNPDPNLKKLKKKLNKKQEPHQQNYNYYYPQYSHGSSYGYPYGRSEETETLPQNGVSETTDTPMDVIGNPSNTNERVANPDPTLAKLKKKLNKKQQQPQQNYYNYYYYPQYSHGSSYSYPYERSHEAMPQNSEMVPEDRPQAILSDPLNAEDTVGNPEPTLTKLKKKMQKKFGQEEHQPYPYPQNYHNSYYPQNSYPSYYRNAETEDMQHNDAIIDDMAMISGEQSFHVIEPTLGDPEPQYNPYSRAAQRGKMLQNMEEHQMDNFMMGELVLPRFANPEPTLKKKKTTAIEHMPPSFYYPQNQYNSYYSPSIYSNAYNNPYTRSTEMVAQNEEGKRLDERVGDVNPFEEEQKSANPEQHHGHKKIEGAHSEGEKNFFYSSNFYERDNEPVEDSASKASMSEQQEANVKLPSSLNKNEQREVQKGTDEPKILPVEENLNSPKASEHIQDGEHGNEDVGCGLGEKIEKKLAKKLKKLLKKDEEPNKNKIEYPYPPMYPPAPSYGGEYEQPEYYRSASESVETNKNNNHAIESQTIMHAIKDEKKNENKNEDHNPSFHPPTSSLGQPGSPNAGKTEKDNKQLVEIQENVNEPMVAPIIYQHIPTPLREFPDNTQEPQNEFHVIEERIKPTSNPNDRMHDGPLNVAPQTMENSRSASYVNHVHENPEDVGCGLDDNLLDPDNSMKSFDPYNFYQRTVEGISEESRNIAEKAKKLLQPQQTPAVIKPPEPAIAYVDVDELSKHGYQADENSHSDVIPFDRIEPLREKSADPTANPHLSHSHGSTHTHTHFISHTHGHNHQKGLSKLHGGQGVRPINSQVFPHHQGISNSGFSQANANAQAFNHGGHHSSIAQANSKTFGNGFGSNAQAEAQSFNGGQINNFGSNSQAGAEAFNHGGQFNDFIPNSAIAQSGAQGFNNGGFGQSGTSAGSLIQNGHHLASNAAIAQSQALTNGVFGQSAALANSQIQNGHNFVPNAAIPQSQAHTNGVFGQSAASANSHTQSEQHFASNAAFAQSQAHTNGGFGQSAAQASAQSGLGGNIGPQTFQHGFGNTQGLAFNNNPGQFASSSANAQIVGQRHEKFVMPHLDELPVKHLLTKMKYGTHRLSRSPQEDLFGGVRLASGIVDASLDRNGVLDGTEQQRSSDEPQDIHGTIGYVAHIVDSGIRAGESNTQRGNIFKTHSPRYSESESARGLAFEGISSITDLVNKGLRFKRQDAFDGLKLASGIVDFSLNENSFLGRTGQQRSSIEPQDRQDAMSYVKDIVHSSIMDGEGNTQRSTSSKTNSLQSQSARGLVGEEVYAITDLVSKGLGAKRQVVSENKNNFEDSLTDTDEVKGLRKLSTDHVSQKSDETGNSDNLALAVNKEADEQRYAGRAPISENSGSQGEEMMVLGMVNPDTIISTPKPTTNQPSEWDHETKAVIYVTPVATDLPIDNDSSKLETNNTNKNLEENHFKEGNRNTTSEHLVVTPPVHQGLEDTFERSEDGTEVLLTNSITEKTLDSITKRNENGMEVTTDFTRRLNKHKNLNMDDLQMDEISPNTASRGSFLGVSNEGLFETGLQETNNNTKGNNQDNLNLDDRKLIKDEEASLANTAALLPYFLFANGTRKNISDLTSEEIQELQFDVPNNSTKDISINPNSKGAIGEILETSLMTDKNVDAKLDDNTKESNQKYDNLNLPNNKMSEENISKANQENSSRISTMRASGQKDLVQQFVFEMFEAPFASIEAEMGVLTEEEKAAFIKQEMPLIEEVIKETFRMQKEHDPSVNRSSETAKNKTSDPKEASESTEKVVTSPNLFQAHERESDREEYSRQAPSDENEKTFNDILGEHREKVEKIKNIAADEDEDLLMISYIGDSVVKDLETRRNQSGEVSQTNHSLTNQFNQTNNEPIEINQIDPIDVAYPIEHMDTFNHANATNNVTDDVKNVDEISLNRTKREISGIRSSRTPLTQLISDPTTKLDVEKTLQNLGSIARHTFENPRAPMYHVRNMLGNAKNSVMSAASVPPNNFLIPSKYEIAEISRNNGEQVGAVNRNTLLSRSGFGNSDSGEDGVDSERNFNGNSVGLEDTVQKLGGMVRESVQRGKDAVEHVNNVAADAKKFLQTSKHTVPRLIVHRPKQKLASRASFDPVVGSELRSKPTLKKKTLITPKILDFQENLVGSAQENPENFVGVGHILDAAGLSQPNQPEVKLQKIVYKPYNINLRPLTIPSKSMIKKAKMPPKKYDVKKEGKDQNAVLGSEQPAVTENLKDFIQRMHDEMREIVRSQYEERKRQRLERTRTKPTNKNKKDFNDFKKATRQISQNQKLNPNILGASKSYYNARKNLEENEDIEISPQVFSQIPQSHLNQNFMRNNGDGVKNELTTPVVLSRMQATSKYEPPSTSYAEKYPYYEQYLTNENPEYTDNEEKVQLFLPDNLMKPFMGQPSESEIQEYMRLNGDEENFEQENSDVSKKTPEISDINKLINLNIPQVESFSPLTYVDSIVPMRRKSPKIPPGLEVSKIKPPPPAHPERSFLTPGLVGAAMPKLVADKINSTTSPEIAEKTKEFVELLSDPEIEDSELPDANQNRSSTSLDSNMHNTLTGPGLKSNTPNIDSDLQETVANSSQKTNENADDANTHTPSIKNEQVEKHQNLENIKHTPSSNLKLKSFTVGPVPDQNDLGYVLGAINPMMFERHFNERLQINDTSSQDTHNTFLNQGIIRNENDDSTTKANTGRPTVPEKSSQSLVKEDETTENLATTKELNDNAKLIQSGNQREMDVVKAQVNSQQKSDKQISETENDLNELHPQGERTSMNVLDPYKKPFMGYIKKDKMNKFLNQYNNNLPEEHDEQHEEYALDENNKQNIEPVKNVVFSSIEGDNDYNNYE